MYKLISAPNTKQKMDILQTQIIKCHLVVPGEAVLVRVLEQLDDIKKRSLLSPHHRGLLLP